MKTVKALVLLSGGLDSILAVKLLQNQRIKVTGLTFKSYFFDAKPAKKAAKQLKIPLIVSDFSKKQLDVVKLPKHGHGKHMNPCIDCHGLMLKEAAKIMKRKNFDFIATGEVLNERPMSQNLQSLRIVEKLSGAEGKILRPLSAKKLPKTIPEKQGLIRRGQLEGISGRSRQRQFALAKKFGIKEYPSPAGGCLLTDESFSERLQKLMRLRKLEKSDFELLKLGRHFWHGQARIIVARNEEECKKLRKIAKKDDFLLEAEDYPGPTTLVRGAANDTALRQAAKLTKYYSTKTRGLERANIKILGKNKTIEV